MRRNKAILTATISINKMDVSSDGRIMAWPEPHHPIFYQGRSNLVAQCNRKCYENKKREETIRKCFVKIQSQKSIKWNPYPFVTRPIHQKIKNSIVLVIQK